MCPYLCASGTAVGTVLGARSRAARIERIKKVDYYYLNQTHARQLHLESDTGLRGAFERPLEESSNLSPNSGDLYRTKATRTWA